MILSISRNCVVCLLPRRQTRPAIMGVNFLTPMADHGSSQVKGKPRKCVWMIVYTFKTSFYCKPFAFYYNKLLQTLFKDQLDRYKETCSYEGISLKAPGIN